MFVWKLVDTLKKPHLVVGIEFHHVLHYCPKFHHLFLQFLLAKIVFNTVQISLFSFEIIGDYSGTVVREVRDACLIYFETWYHEEAAQLRVYYPP
jgi:hypothetical protein